MLLSEIAKKIGAEIVFPSGGKDFDVKRLAPINEAKEGELTFIANPDYFKFLDTTRASAVILNARKPDAKITQLVCRNPYASFARAAQLFHVPDYGKPGISDKAVVAATAKIGRDVVIGPFAVIADHVEIGDRVVIFPGVYVGRGVNIGEDTVVHANSVIYERSTIGKRVLMHAGTVIGADGFGFAVGDDDIVKIPQVGTVRIEDDVEFGACCTVDRAAMGETLVKRGTKFDDKVHIGHNAVIGEHCLFSAQTAIAGSARIGNWVKTGGHAGVAGHLDVGDGVSIGAMTGVIKEAEAGKTYLGFPAVEAGIWRRRQVYFGRLPELEKRVKELEEKLAALNPRD